MYNETDLVKLYIKYKRAYMLKYRCDEDCMVIFIFQTCFLLNKSTSIVFKQENMTLCKFFISSLATFKHFYMIFLQIKILLNLHLTLKSSQQVFFPPQAPINTHHYSDIIELHTPQGFSNIPRHRCRWKQNAHRILHCVLFDGVASPASNFSISLQVRLAVHLMWKKRKHRTGEKKDECH